ncbi:hypothetical protein E2C01_071170 [Portunus trituberculatus]|uniref:Uncharacterized protein n=1 Tax=Portunus trituberculatus TaxID=210409 RepID=A0A5B7HZB3_PORTR|nr:hypothetical protein [Portunus trituberculatus]
MLARSSASQLPSCPSGGASSRKEASSAAAEVMSSREAEKGDEEEKGEMGEARASTCEVMDCGENRIPLPSSAASSAGEGNGSVRELAATTPSGGIGERQESVEQQDDTSSASSCSTDNFRTILAACSTTTVTAPHYMAPCRPMCFTGYLTPAHP